MYLISYVALPAVGKSSLDPNAVFFSRKDDLFWQCLLGRISSMTDWH